MLEYTAPVHDMRFVINELIGLSSVRELNGFNEVSEDLVNAVLEEASKLATEVLAPLNRSGDIEGCRQDGDAVFTPKGWRAAYEAFCEGGWNGLDMDPRYGGQGLPKVVATAVSEMWDAANLSFSLCPLLTAGAIEAIERHGSPEMRRNYLEKMVSGVWSGTMNLTEPQAGSDLGAVRTAAVPEGDHYRITGQKIFITYGEHDLTSNIVHLVLARIQGAPSGTRGISLFVVPKILVNEDGTLGERNDVRCVSIEHKLGIHGSPTAVLSYGDEDGAIGYLVGEENRGLAHMFTMMNRARHAVGREGIALADGSYQQALKYARDRVQGRAAGATAPSPLIDHPDVKRMLMTMKSQIEAMRALACACAVEYDVATRHADAEKRAQAQRRGDFLTPIVKGWCSETGQELTSLGIQIHGGMGYVEETGAAQYLRDVRITTIYEGTTGIQAGDLVGRKTLRDGGASARELIADMRRTVGDMSDCGGPVVTIRKKLAEGISALEEVVEWLIAEGGGDPQLPGAVAASYLRLCGVVCGGWMMARAAHICDEQPTKDGADAPFYSSKLASASFYAAQIMPTAAALASTIIEGSHAITQLDEKAF